MRSYRPVSQKSTLGILPGWGGCTQMILRRLKKDDVTGTLLPRSSNHSR